MTYFDLFNKNCLIEITKYLITEDDKINLYYAMYLKVDGYFSRLEYLIN
jgi:hypothetical protein